jgi:RHS repeat-associated protein
MISSRVPNPFTYTARETADAGFMYYRARYYQPSVGRFVSEDPLRWAEGPNFYAYVGDNPIKFSDPSGLYGFSLPPIGLCLKPFRDLINSIGDWKNTMYHTGDGCLCNSGGFPKKCIRIAVLDDWQIRDEFDKRVYQRLNLLPIEGKKI